MTFQHGHTHLAVTLCIWGVWAILLLSPGIASAQSSWSGSGSYSLTTQPSNGQSCQAEGNAQLSLSGANPGPVSGSLTLTVTSLTAGTCAFSSTTLYQGTLAGSASGASFTLSDSSGDSLAGSTTTGGMQITFATPAGQYLACGGLPSCSIVATATLSGSGSLFPTNVPGLIDLPLITMGGGVAGLGLLLIRPRVPSGVTGNPFSTSSPPGGGSGGPTDSPIQIGKSPSGAPVSPGPDQWYWSFVSKNGVPVNANYGDSAQVAWNQWMQRWLYRDQHSGYWFNVSPPTPPPGPNRYIGSFVSLKGIPINPNSGDPSTIAWNDQLDRFMYRNQHTGEWFLAYPPGC